MASTTPTAHFFVGWAPVHLYLPVFVLLFISLGLYLQKTSRTSIMEEILGKPHLLSQGKAVGH